MSALRTIKISNVPVSYVEELDRIAKRISEKTGKKLSRNELLNRIIAYEVEHKRIEKEQERFESALTQNEIVIQNLVNELKNYTRFSEELISILTSGLISNE